MYSHPNNHDFSSGMAQYGSNIYTQPLVPPSPPPQDSRTQAISTLYKQNSPNKTSSSLTETNSPPIKEVIHSVLSLLNKNSVSNPLKILPKLMLDYLQSFVGDEVSELNQLALKIANLRCSTSTPICYEGIKLECKEGDTIFNLYERTTNKNDVDVLVLNLKNVVLPLYLYLEDAVEKNHENALSFQVCLNDTRTQFQSYPTDHLLYKQIEECKASFRERNRYKSLEKKKEIYEDFELFPRSTKLAQKVSHSVPSSFYNPPPQTCLPNILAQPSQICHSPTVNLRTEKPHIPTSAQQSFRSTDNSIEIQRRATKPPAAVIHPSPEKPLIPAAAQQSFRSTDNSIEIQRRATKPPAAVIHPSPEKPLIPATAQQSFRSTDNSIERQRRLLNKPPAAVVHSSTEKPLIPATAQQSFRSTDNSIERQRRLLNKPPAAVVHPSPQKPLIPAIAQQSFRSTDNSIERQRGVIKPPAAVIHPSPQKPLIPASAQAAVSAGRGPPKGSKSSPITVKPSPEKLPIPASAQAAISTGRRPHKGTKSSPITVKPSTEKQLIPEPSKLGVKTIQWHNAFGNQTPDQLRSHTSCRTEATPLTEPLSTSDRQHNLSTRNPSHHFVNSSAATTQQTTKKTFIPASQQDNFIQSNRTNAQMELTRLMDNTFNALNIPPRKDHESAQQNFPPSQKQSPKTIDLLTPPQRESSLIDQENLPPIYSSHCAKTSSPGFGLDHGFTAFPIEEQSNEHSSTYIPPFPNLGFTYNRPQIHSPAIAYSPLCSPFSCMSPSFSDTSTLTNQKKSKKRSWEKEKGSKTANKVRKKPRHHSPEQTAVQPLPITPVSNLPPDFNP